MARIRRPGRGSQESRPVGCRPPDARRGAVLATSASGESSLTARMWRPSRGKFEKRCPAGLTEQRPAGRTLSPPRVPAEHFVRYVGHRSSRSDRSAHAPLRPVGCDRGPFIGLPGRVPVPPGLGVVLAGLIEDTLRGVETVAGSVERFLSVFAGGWASARASSTRQSRPSAPASGGHLAASNSYASGVAVLNTTPETKDEPGAQNDAAKEEERSKEGPKNQSRGDWR